MRSVVSALLRWISLGSACQWAEKTTTALGLTFWVISLPMAWRMG